MLRELLTALKNIFTWWWTISPWEQGVRVRAGKHVKLLEAGLHLRIPVLDRFYVQSVRLRYICVPTQTVTTKDGKALTISGGLAYSIEDILKLYQTIHDPVDTIEMMCCGIIASTIEGKEAAEVSPKDVEKAVNEELNLEEYGLTNTLFKVTDWALVRTYRLIQGEPKSYGGSCLDTSSERSSTAEVVY